MILLTCPECKRELQVPPERAGLKVICPVCKTVLTVPPAQRPAAPLPPARHAERATLTESIHGIVGACIVCLGVVGMIGTAIGCMASPMGFLALAIGLATFGYVIVCGLMLTAISHILRYLRQIASK